MKTMENKVALVTGAARGIGLARAHATSPTRTKSKNWYVGSRKNSDVSTRH